MIIFYLKNIEMNATNNNNLLLKILNYNNLFCFSKYIYIQYRKKLILI